MKNFITKYWSLIGLISAFVLDHYLQILKGFNLDPEQVDLIKLFGTLLYGYFFTSSYNKEEARNLVGGRPDDRPK